MASFCCYNNSDRMSLQPWSWQISVYLIQLVVIFLNVCLWRHSLRSDLEGIDPEKLYLATFICQYALYCYKVWPSFFFVDECFVKIWATCHNFLGKWFTAPSGKKLPVRLWYPSLITRKSSRGRQPPSRVNVTGLLRQIQVEIEIYLSLQNNAKAWKCF